MKNYIFIILLILVISCSKKPESPPTPPPPKIEDKGIQISKITQDKIILNATEIDLIKKHVDKWVIVKGRVFRVYAPEKSKAIFINFSNDKDKGFTSVVFTSNLNKWPGGRDFFTSLIGKVVEVEGPIQEFKGKFEIIINAPSQLNIIDERTNLKLELDFGQDIASMHFEDIQNQEEGSQNTNTAKKESSSNITAGSYSKPEDHRLMLGDELSIDFILIHPGKFLMGTKSKPFDPFTNKNPDASLTNEQPQHEVTISKPFYLGKYEITQEQWYKVMNTNPSTFKGQSLPVTNISWKECKEFIRKVNLISQREYRLPTEAEWEYACRAGTTTAYSCGDEITPKDANFFDSRIGKPVAVGNYKPNAFGLYDMHGNARELCNDWYGPYPNTPQTNPLGPNDGEGKVVRGGSFNDYNPGKIIPRFPVGFIEPKSSETSNLTSSGRSFLQTNSLMPYTITAQTIGFRLALSKDIINKSPLAQIALESPFTETEAKTTQKKVAAILGREVEEKEIVGNRQKIDTILIPAGSFIRNEDFNSNEHEITISKSFYMGKFEITQEQWMALMGTNPSFQKGEKLPVTNVSWDDCQLFIKKLNAKTNGRYRLPTEAEWEYACRAGSAEPQPNVNNFRPNSQTTNGNSEPNAFGLYNMHGYAEWCNDWYDSHIKGNLIDPVGPKSGTNRVLKSGSLLKSIPSPANYSYRNYAYQSSRMYDCSFRLAKSIDFEADKVAQDKKIETQANLPKPKTYLEQPFPENPANEIQKGQAKSFNMEVEKKINLSTNVALEMIFIPPGKFLMGSPLSELSRKTDETEHEMSITKPFYMGKYEITLEQWATVLGRDLPKSLNPKSPVNKISWDDCQLFISKMNDEYGGGFRLPTEHEWEYACKAGTTSPYSFGEKITKTEGNFDHFATKPVGSFKPNAFGLYDMHGNVAEWCSDFYSNYPGSNNEIGKNLETYRILRGGGYNQPASNVRSSSRLSSPQNYRAVFNGMRLVKTITP